MKRRLVGSTLAIALVCVLGLGVPLAILARHQVWTAARDRIRAQAGSVASGVEDRLDAGQKVDLHRYASLMPGQRIIVASASGRVVVAGPRLGGGVLEATIQESGNRVTVQAERQVPALRAEAITLIVAAVGALVTLIAVALAQWQARRLARPIAELASQADALGRGGFTSAALASGVPEIDDVSRVLQRSGQQIGALVDLQRHFASDAAHQLRTPLTSISLHLDEIAVLGDESLREEVDEALGQVERLNGVINGLLARARGDTIEPTVLDLSRVVTRACPVWERLLAQDDRRLVLDTGTSVLVRARPDHVDGVLASLLDNALHHGAGDVTVVVTQTAASAQLRVRDEGPGVPPMLLNSIFERRVSGSRGTGIGLALAHALAGAESGSLTVSEENRAEFVFALPSLPATRTPSPRTAKASDR